ncbi:MAG: serine/threonine-protein kinase [Polyangiaceae bacterium]
MSAPDPLVGATVGGYRVLARIGEGGMATVYRAQARDGQEVALKVLNPDVAGSREFVRRFQREGQTAVLLRHRSTVRTLQFGVDGRRLFIAMELIAGRDLFELLVAEVRFAPARAARVIAEVCDALEEAHARGIVHRDLKPENIMLYPDPGWPGGEGVKVLDFGIAKLLDSDEPPMTVPGQPQELSALTRFGSLIGTPEYIAPEQARGEPVDARSDVYSCGIVLYQLVAGEAPFSGDAPLSIVVRHVREPPRPPSSLVPGLNADLEAIILRALAKQPADRWQSAAAMRDALLSVLPRLRLDLGSRPPPPPRTPARRRSSASALTIPVMELRAPPPPPGSLVPEPDEERTHIMPDADGLRRRKPGEDLPTLQNLGAKAPPASAPRVDVEPAGAPGGPAAGAAAAPAPAATASAELAAERAALDACWGTAAPARAVAARLAAGPASARAPERAPGGARRVRVRGALGGDPCALTR